MNPEWVQANQSLALLSGQLLWLSSLAMFLGSPSGQAFLAIHVGHPFCPMGARLGRISRGTRGCPDRWGLSLHFKASGPLPPSQTLLANARSQTLQVYPTGQILLAIEPSLPSQNLRAKPSRPIPLGQTLLANPPSQATLVRPSGPISPSQPPEANLSEYKHAGQSSRSNHPSSQRVEPRQIFLAEANPTGQPSKSSHSGQSSR